MVLEKALLYGISIQHRNIQSYIKGSPKTVISKIKHLSWNEAKPNLIRPNKKIFAFRVAQPYLNIQCTGETLNSFQDFWKKYIISCILKGKMPLKMHTIKFFPEKN